MNKVLFILKREVSCVLCSQVSVLNCRSCYCANSVFTIFWILISIAELMLYGSFNESLKTPGLADGEIDEQNPNLIHINITKACDQALKRYHGWIVQKVFTAALFAAPCRSDFLKALSKDQEVAEEDCLAKIRQFLINFTATVDAIYEMYSVMNAELDYLV
uniref:Glycolipid transfer protein b n=1 Tax=Sinocyclocheilus rhinocerous TaxID=307959 RepID=A0A673MCN7_9TELE